MTQSPLNRATIRGPSLHHGSLSQGASLPSHPKQTELGGRYSERKLTFWHTLPLHLTFFSAITLACINYNPRAGKEELQLPAAE